MKNKLEKCILNKDSTIWDAVKLIQKNALQTALIVDNNNKLLGIITDGDIRRALLNRIDFGVNVSKIMNKNPVVVKKDLEISKIRRIMKENVLHLIPVVENDGTVIDLVFFTDVINANILNNPVVLMAGGLGSRLKELTKECPKPLLNVGNKPILETIIENFIEQGFVNFYLSVNYKSEQIESYFGDGSRYGVSIKYLHEKKALGTAGALSNLPEDIEDPVIVMNGDILTKIDFTKMMLSHEKSKSVATMAVRPYTEKIPYGVINSKDGIINSIKEKPEINYKVNAGIYILNKSAINKIPKNEFYNMTQLFEKLIKTKRLVSEYVVNEYWIDIGRIEDFNKANIDIVKICN
ncbi:MAG: nucleotidyltransferase family protein [Spirochaetales bacterium]|nr:nucleotidyltransferase family protein [Spirochaetales bacterium]